MNTHDSELWSLYQLSRKSSDKLAEEVVKLRAEIERLKIALELKDHDFKTRWSAMLGD